MNASFTARLNLALAMVIVGSSVVAGKIMVQELPVFLASALRFLLASALMVPLLRLREGGFPRLSRRSLGLLALQSLCGSFLFTVFLLHGLKLTSPASAGIITSTTPACIGLMAWLFLGERPRRATILGILLATGGVLVINTQGPGASASPAPLAGNLLVVAAVVSESAFLLLRKGVRDPLSPLAASTLVSLFGLAWFLVPGAWEAMDFDFARASAVSWWAVAYYGMFVTVLAYLLWFAGIVRVDAATAGVFTAAMPLSALGLARLVLREPLAWQHMVGCGMALGAILLLSRKGT